MKKQQILYKKNCTILKQLLADEQILLAKTRNFHWNLTGDQFLSLHKLFDDQYEQLASLIDEIAERIRQLHDSAPGTLREYLAMTKLKEPAKKTMTQKQMITELLSDHTALIDSLRKNIPAAEQKDAGTVDFLTSILQIHEKNAWFLQSQL
ncbi:MAG: Dps family protein [Candidatus Woesearchaeota archaeon]